MKKAIALLLILTMCFGLVACGNLEIIGDIQPEQNNAKNEILGEWTFFEYGITVTFNKDGTGTDNDGYSFTWKYDEDLKYYTIAMQTEDGVSTFDTMIQKTTHPAITYIIVHGQRFYHFAKDDLNGCKVFTVTSKDMSPAVNDGDTVLCKSFKKPADLSIGDIIVYWTVLDGQRVAYASRIKNIYKNDSSELIFETQDDGSETPNVFTVHQSEVLGTFEQVIIGANT